MAERNAPAAKRHSASRWLLAGICFALFGCSEPLGPLAGGELSGRLSPIPATWQDVPDTVQIETRPANPYSVNLWIVHAGTALYITGDLEGKRWIGHVRADRNVRLRIDDAIYALIAVEVDADDERRQVTDAFAAKYGDDNDDGADFMANDAIFRLQPPDGAQPPPQVAPLPLQQTASAPSG